jgi:hypothetical protein
MAFGSWNPWHTVELNMFDLEQQIRLWRAELAAAMGDRAEAVDELESHLREQAEQLISQGRPPERAWEEALRRLGTPEQLATEFRKVALPRWTPAWVAGIVLALTAFLVGWIAVSHLLVGRRDALLAVHVFTVSVGYVAVFAVGFLALWATIQQAVGAWNGARDAALRSSGAKLALVATVATAVGAALGTWWARDHMGRWWAWDPRELGGLAVLGWSILLLRSFHARASATQLLLLLGITGNLVVALAWFGPVLLETGHSYGFSMLGMLLGTFIISQIVALYAAVSWCPVAMGN